MSEALASPAVLRGEAAFQQARRRRRLGALGAGLALGLAVLVAAWISEFRPEALLAGLPRVGDYFARLAPTLHWNSLFGGVKAEGSLAYWFYRLDKWSWLIFETANMAALATLAGTAAALPLSFLAARNLSPNTWSFQLARRALEAVRTVPELVYALILVWAFGVGALAGILAIALHSAGALGKLFAEAVENTEMGAWDGVRASGATWAQGCRWAILPQVAPSIVSYVLLRFEINVRGASVIGFVGAGGIGEELYTVISSNYYEEISAIVLLIVLTVVLIDLLSERLRHRLIGRRA
ncbi:phosphonate ABC transporter, permease protein PhnE [Roseomonas sp. BN140053]|uniref:phosphonate ABC transporter, permease protein PhnE n=1 Tax=Roseomonas sp. BN140053 TaxID=3391898 RepID=UPI0039EA4747